MKKYISSKNIIKAIKGKGYKFFSKGSYNLNIIGIRSNDSQSDRFDDEIHVLFKDEKGEECHEVFPCTTDPGKHWLLNPMNKKGTIIMVPGQYRGAYQIGIHGRSRGNGYKALEQVKEITYVRDNSKDSELDFKLYADMTTDHNSDKFEISNAKTNIHRASKWKNLLNVGRYSAGCQVIQSPDLFNRLIVLCELQIKHNQGKSFTYTLLEEKDF
jgi:hypothetical protein